MQLDPKKFAETLSLFSELKLMDRRDVEQILSVLGPQFPYAASLEKAESIHIHIHVDDVSALPHDRIRAAGSVPENQKDGYVKYPFLGGINVIFSSIDVAQDDLLHDSPKRPRPFVDHYGVDIREESPEARAHFDEVPARAATLGWRHVPQGGQGQPVYCCHVEVAEKHWVYPPTADAAWTCPVEFAFGALKINGSKMGCDLRPIDPAHPAASQVLACGAHGGDAVEPPAAGAGHAGYYDRRDLARFGEVGRFASATMAKFFDYYNAATATDGALSKREKALIGLAVAHSKQCPYCIEAYTAQCLETGSNPEQMHEAVHVAAALGAGIDLVHGVQMQNALRSRGAI